MILMILTIISLEFLLQLEIDGVEIEQLCTTFENISFDLILFKFNFNTEIAKIFFCVSLFIIFFYLLLLCFVIT